MDQSAPRKTAVSPGRPRAFDEKAVLDAALQVFWRQGYEATSIDDLTAAMGLSRSSFYGAFGSKQAVLEAALSGYSKSALARLKDIVQGNSEDPLAAALDALADPNGGTKGCLLVNCITELAPHHPEIAALGRRHLAGIEQILAEAINPEDPGAARTRARAFSALALGTVTLRKSGVAAEQITETLKEAQTVLR